MKVDENGLSPFKKRTQRVWAVRAHLIGLGVPGVSVYSHARRRHIAIEGWNVRFVTDLTRSIRTHGWRALRQEWESSSPLPLLVIDVPHGAREPEDVRIIMSIEGFARLTRKDPAR